MFFSSPIYLLALLSLPIPFILHLFERRRTVRVEFPWLHIVEESLKGGNLFLKLKELLLLAIRTLLLIFLVFAFADPLVRKEKGIIIVDDSYDMFARDGDEILFNDAKDIAEKLAGERGFDIALSSGREYIPQILPTYRMFQPPDIEGKNILFITSKSLPQTKGIIMVEIEKNLLSIDTVYLKDPLPQVGSDNILLVGITNHGEYEIQRTLSIHSMDDSTYIEVSLPPGQTYVSLPIKFKRADTYSGYVDIGDDALSLDNVMYFSFRLPEKIRVGIVVEDTSRSFYIEKALSPEGIETSIEIERTTYPRLPFADVFIFVDVPYTETGIPSIIFREGKFRKASKGFFLSLKDIDRTHPAFSIFDDACINEIATRKIYKRAFDRIEGRRIASFSDGGQAIVEREGSLFFLFLPTVENTNIVLSPNFPPLLHRMVRYLREGKEYPTMIPWGRDMRITVKENRTYEVCLLAGEERWRISPLPDRGGLYLRFTPPYPGIYNIDKVGKTAVNIDRQMSTVYPFKENVGRVSLKRYLFLVCLILVFIEMFVRNLRP
jgi:hypothetical protein